MMPRPRGGDWLEGEMQMLGRQGVGVLVSALERGEAHELGLAREAELCEVSGVRWVSFPIEDRGVPGSRADFEGLAVSLADAVRAGDSVVVHCRQGIGRASMIVAGVLLALGWESAWDAVSAARGRPVPDTPAQRAWVDEGSLG